jgi:hypothetical protein
VGGTLAGIVGVFTTQSAYAVTTLLSDNFDSENGGSASPATENYTNFSNWDITDGSVDLVGNGFLDDVPGNGLYVDLDGGTFDAGTMESKTAFSFNPGDDVTLTFSILGSNGSGNQMTVSLGSLFSNTFTDVDSGIQTINTTVGALTSATLVFDHAGGDNQGLLIDNVNLSVSAAVPFEFSPSLGLLLVGAGFGIKRGRNY